MTTTEQQQAPSSATWGRLAAVGRKLTCVAVSGPLFAAVGLSEELAAMQASEAEALRWEAARHEASL